MSTEVPCRANPDAWFPGKGQGHAREVQLAKALCGACPLREECLRIGMNEKYGIWGGLTESERERLKRRQGRRPRACATCGGSTGSTAPNAKYCGPCRVEARRASWTAHDVTRRAAA